ncbi:MAG: gliding-motility protein MglA [Myxococcales bacterium]|nr:gliding-motility protein MglA [Myxococcales bacterium]
MPLIDHNRKELHLKLVYYGPGLCGKTTNLETIHQRSRPDLRGKLVSLKTESERTLFFDLLPVNLGSFHGYSVRIHLCTVPGQVAFDSTRRLVLRHVDGVVFVVDSQATRLEDNVDSMENLATNLRLQGDDPDRLPLVVQYNKRDLPGVLPVDDLREALAIPGTVPQFEAVATTGVGVFDTFKAITKETLRTVGNPADLPEGRTAPRVPSRRPSLFPRPIS